MKYRVFGLLPVLLCGACMFGKKKFSDVVDFGEVKKCEVRSEAGGARVLTLEETYVLIATLDSVSGRREAKIIPGKNQLSFTMNDGKMIRC
jgi:hypothetical protein